MPKAKHPKAALLVQKQFFASLTSFAELEQKIAALPDEQSRGAAFEVFAEAYLTTQRKYDAAQVWPHGSVPPDTLRRLGLTESDQGVDGVLQTLLGQFNAYQVKFRTRRQALTWRELSTFIGLADSPHIHSRVLLTNCDELPAVLNDRQGFFCIRGSDLDRLEAGDFRAMEAWLGDAAYIAPKKSPQPHQTEALDALLPALQRHDRVSAIMACGTGKTLVALWVAESVAQASTPAGSGGVPPPVGGHAPGRCLNPSRNDAVASERGCDASSRETINASFALAGGSGDEASPTRSATRASQPRILILLPSLALLRQTLHEWLRETNLPNLAYLCVCSDASVKEGIDALTTQQSDLDFQVSTEAASVRSFLDAPFAGVKMIFSTYQSASMVGATMKPGETFDFAVFDEAHKTAGRAGRNFAFALDDKNLPIRKRLFLTAMPRHYNPHDRDREGEARLLFSMDNPAVYGPQAYRLTFAEAARRGIICGYKVIISVITSEMVTNELLSHGEVLVNGDAVRAREVANQIALRDAIEKYGVKKVFTFHRDVKSAQSFVSAGPEGVGTHLNGSAGFQPAGSSGVPAASSETAGGDARLTRTQDACATFQTFHVNGSMPTARRERELRDFRAAARAVVSNARCLTEGVDVPAVDMVAFLSPRRAGWTLCKPPAAPCAARREKPPAMCWCRCMSNCLPANARSVVECAVALALWVGATPKTATGTGALPSKVPLVAVRKHRPMAVWGGRTGQRARSRGATADSSPRREPWVKRTKRIQPRRGRKKITGGWFSVAPSGAWMVLTTRPTVSPWATICRASGAGAGRAPGWPAVKTRPKAV